jgi:hypothetical protein
MSFYEELKAFPVNTEWDYGGEQGYKTAGMNLRDYFAAKAMQGIVDSSVESGLETIQIAESAYRIADAMMEARNESI